MDTKHNVHSTKIAFLCCSESGNTFLLALKYSATWIIQFQLQQIYASWPIIYRTASLTSHIGSKSWRTALWYTRPQHQHRRLRSTAPPPPTRGHQLELHCHCRRALVLIVHCWVPPTAATCPHPHHHTRHRTTTTSSLGNKDSDLASRPTIRMVEPLYRLGRKGGAGTSAGSAPWC